ncbi:MAG: hypothetical protein HPY76_07250 [Anaerolineae bacterium]|jgi:hypothetical protein|nr:hypothetical protein [Anaerolineae bacterium]
MNFTPGTIVVAVAMAVFYLRLAQLRGKKKREIRKAELARIRKPRKKGQPAPPPNPNPRVTYQITSWWLIGLGAALMLFGLAILTSNWFPAEWREYWWTVTTAGVIVFLFCFK